MKTLTGQIKKINRLSGQLTTPRAAPGGSEFKDVDIDVLTEQFSETLPMTFSTTAEALEDYCIYGNDGGVGDPVNKLTVTLQSGTTINGVTATVSGGTIVLNGTATATAFFYPCGDGTGIDIVSGDRLTGCPSGGNVSSGYSLQWRNTGGSLPFFIDTGAGVIVDQTLPNGRVMIRIAAGVTCNNLTFKPVLYSDCPLPINVRGKNLFNEEYDPPIEANVHYLPIHVGDGAFTLSSNIPLNNEGYANLFLMQGIKSSGFSSSVHGVWDGNPHTEYTRDEGYVTIVYRNRNVDGEPLSPADYNVQLESGTTATAYEPYFNETVTINLDFPLYYDDVVTMSDAGVTIPTVIGSNTLTVGTTVQPAAVQVKYQS